MTLRIVIAALLFMLLSISTSLSYAWTDDPLTASTAIRQIHVAELRTAINTKRQAMGMAQAAWTNPTLSASSSAIRAVHIQELRAALTQIYTTAGVTPPTFSNNPLAADSTPIRAIHIIELRQAFDNAAAASGTCGSANGTAVAAAPTSNLCAAGTASAVSGSGPWTWSCSGRFGGSTASCSAPPQAVTGTWQQISGGGGGGCAVGSIIPFNNCGVGTWRPPTIIGQPCNPVGATCMSGQYCTRDPGYVTMMFRYECR